MRGDRNIVEQLVVVQQTQRSAQTARRVPAPGRSTRRRARGRFPARSAASAGTMIRSALQTAETPRRGSAGSAARTDQVRASRALRRKPSRGRSRPERRAADIAAALPQREQQPVRSPAQYNRDIRGHGPGHAGLRQPENGVTRARPAASAPLRSALLSPPADPRAAWSCVPPVAARAILPG